MPKGESRAQPKKLGHEGQLRRHLRVGETEEEKSKFKSAKEHADSAIRTNLKWSWDTRWEYQTQKWEAIHMYRQSLKETYDRELSDDQVADYFKERLKQRQDHIKKSKKKKGFNSRNANDGNETRVTDLSQPALVDCLIPANNHPDNHPAIISTKSLNLPQQDTQPSSEFDLDFDIDPHFWDVVHSSSLMDEPEIPNLYVPKFAPEDKGMNSQASPFSELLISSPEFPIVSTDNTQTFSRFPKLEEHLQEQLPFQCFEEVMNESSRAVPKVRLCQNTPYKICRLKLRAGCYDWQTNDGLVDDLIFVIDGAIFIRFFYQTHSSEEAQECRRRISFCEGVRIPPKMKYEIKSEKEVEVLMIMSRPLSSDPNHVDASKRGVPFSTVSNGADSEPNDTNSHYRKVEKPKNLVIEKTLGYSTPINFAQLFHSPSDEHFHQSLSIGGSFDIRCVPLDGEFAIVSEGVQTVIIVLRGMITVRRGPSSNRLSINNVLDRIVIKDTGYGCLIPKGIKYQLEANTKADVLFLRNCPIADDNG